MNEWHDAPPAARAMAINALHLRVQIYPGSFDSALMRVDLMKLLLLAKIRIYEGTIGCAAGSACRL